MRSHRVWPFSRNKKPAIVTLPDDVFWLRDAPRIDGLIAAASRAISSGSHVLLVTHVAARVAQLAGQCAYGWSVQSHYSYRVDRSLAKPAGRGACVLLSLAATLRPSPAASLTARVGTTPAQPAAIVVLIADRHPLRARDEAIVSFAESLAAGRAELHVCIEDPVFKCFAGDRTETILRTLGMKEGESLTHPMLTRSVERTQKKLADQCPDHGKIESWLAEQLRK